MMKRVWFVLAVTALCAGPLAAATRGVAAELFTATW